jgi:hypothetical protein
MRAYIRTVWREQLSIQLGIFLGFKKSGELVLIAQGNPNELQEKILGCLKMSGWDVRIVFDNQSEFHATQVLVRAICEDEATKFWVMDDDVVFSERHIEFAERMADEADLEAITFCQKFPDGKLVSASGYPVLILDTYMLYCNLKKPLEPKEFNFDEVKDSPASGWAYFTKKILDQMERKRYGVVLGKDIPYHLYVKDKFKYDVDWDTAILNAWGKIDYSFEVVYFPV